jgi:four helix bundle protein
MEDLKSRTFQFALNVGKLIIEMPDSKVNRHYFAQLVCCSSSVGANYRAARRAKSNADFINKLKIVEEECDESIYFLELLLEFNTDYIHRLKALIDEATAILKIIVASILTAKQKSN